MKIPNWRTWPNQVFTVPASAALSGFLFYNAYEELAATTWLIRVAAVFGVTCWSAALGCGIIRLLDKLRGRERPGHGWIAQGGGKARAFDARQIRPEHITWAVDLAARRKAAFIEELRAEARDNPDDDGITSISFEQVKAAAQRVPDFTLTYDVDPVTGERSNMLWASPKCPPSWSQAGPRRKPERWPWLRLPYPVWAPVVTAVVALALCVGGSLLLGTLIDANKSTPHYLGLAASLLTLAAVLAVPVGLLLTRWFEDRGI